MYEVELHTHSDPLSTIVPGHGPHKLVRGLKKPDAQLVHSPNPLVDAHSF